MSELDTLVNVSITATSATPSVPNFGTPAVYAYHSHNTDLVRTYQDLAGMVADGFSTTEPAYLMATAIVSQNPRPPTFKVIRATAAPAHVFTFKVTDTNTGDNVGFQVTNAANGTKTDMRHVNTAGQTAIQIAAAIVALAPSGCSAANSGTDTVTLTVTAAGNIFYPSDFFGGQFADTTALAATHPDVDLTAAIAVDNDWYGLAIEDFDANNIANVAVWTEANKKIFVAQTTDYSALVDTEGGITDVLADAAYTRTYIQYTGTPAQYGVLGLLAQRLTADPGSDTWAYKTVAGLTADSLTPTQLTNLDTENANYYINVAGVNVALFGRASSGLFVDITRGIDALAADIQTRIYNLLISNPKVPFTQAGISQVGGQVRAALQAAVATGFLSGEDGFQPSVSLPLVGNANPIDKKARVLKGVNFVAYAAGAVHQVRIVGTVNL